MSFSLDMQAMSVNQITEAVKNRLLRGQGMPWNLAQGEPIWGLLQDAFAIWQDNDAQQKAFAYAVHETFLKAIEEKNWRALEACAELVLALAHSTQPWTPTGLENWPLMHCLNTPPKTLEQAWAMTEVLKLVSQLKIVTNEVSASWCLLGIRKQANQVVQQLGDQAASIYWLTSLWSALQERQGFQAHQLPWYDVWRSHASLRDTSECAHSMAVVLSEVSDVMTPPLLVQAVGELVKFNTDAVTRRLFPMMKLNWPHLASQLEALQQDVRKRNACTSHARKAPQQLLRTPSLVHQISRHRSARGSDLCYV
jgi:hypothetical protein